MGALRQELEDEGLLEHISERRMNQLLQRADSDANQLITYREFVRMVCLYHLLVMVVVVVVVTVVAVCFCCCCCFPPPPPLFFSAFLAVATINLGVCLDSNLSIHQRISYVCKAANFEPRKIASLKSCLTQSAMIQLTLSLILSHLEYC